MILEGKTRKGKNRIHELGNEWDLIRTSDAVLFSQRIGPWGLIRPKNDVKSEKSRWIHLMFDQDFDIVG